MTFFTTWQMWEKLCFFLGCAVVAIVVAGATKVVYTHWRLRNYSVLAEKDRREQMVQRQMSQRRRHDEVPFGIRALEHGLEVDGVWVSRPTTPEGSHRKDSNISDVEKQLWSAGEFSDPPSIATSTRDPSSNTYRVISTERLQAIRRSCENENHITKPTRARHPPCSHEKWSSHTSSHRYSLTQSSFQELEIAQQHSLEAIRRASTSEQPDGTSSGNHSDDSGHSGNDTDSITAAAPRLFIRPTPRPRDHSVDLELMASHRRSQAAETGQLTPRTRRPGQSRDSSIASMRTGNQHNDYFSNMQKSPSDGGSPTNPFSSPKIDALPASVRRSSMPDVTPFAQFCQTAPPSPKSTSVSTTPLGSSHGTRRNSEGLDRFTSPSSSPVISPISPLTLCELPAEPVSVTSLQSSRPRRTSFEKVASPVIRGYGSGFEILKPGSLHPPEAMEQPLERTRAGPPISLHNHTRRSRSSGVGSTGRKLQKKRRPSIDSTSTGSSGSGRQSRNSIR
ncbi:hypothetical protein LTR86_005490 [Recurvomyces mirabilis]|nr:hypothetical protein LTR86_005490 [Recurvomyces mirabilis]